ncbi:MAG: AEC family transporter [Lachnospiraceae bacterium]|nr:AEC family transporter [Lachnospiraceae bacterium]
MELSFLLFQKIISMALIMLMGYAIRKTGTVKDEQTPIISALLLYILVPCMVFNSFLRPFSQERFQAFVLAMVSMFTAQLIFILLAWLLGKTPLRFDSTEQACIAYTNCGNLLIPLINSMLGPEYVFYSVPFLAANTICAWIHIPALISGEFKPDFRKILLNPAILSIIAGIVFFCFGITLPGIIADTITGVANSVGIVSMLLTGMLMAGIDLKGVFSNPRYLGVSFVRLIMFPMLLVLILALTGLTHRSDMYREVLMVMVMSGAAPTATVVIMMTNLFGGKAELASAISAMTTILCIITLPVVVYFYQLLC